MNKIINYYIICDKCGTKMTTEDSGWITIDENHYCPNCYEFIFLSDEYKPKK